MPENTTVPLVRVKKLLKRQTGGTRLGGTTMKRYLTKLIRKIIKQEKALKKYLKKGKHENTVSRH